MRTNSRPVSPLERALLGLIDQEPRAGYDLRKIFQATPLAAFSDSPGAVYPALARLRARGWIAPVARKRLSGRRKQEFRMTSAGRRAFLAWLRLPPTRGEVVRDLDGLQLRFAFMSQAVPVEVPLAFLDQLEHELAQHLRGLEEFFATAQGGMTPTGRLAFESGLGSVRAAAAWCEHAQATLRAPSTRSRRSS